MAFTTAAVTWDLLDCAEQALSDAGLPEPAGIVAVPGADPVWDSDCGMLYVRVISQYPTTSFPNQIPPLNDCGSQKVVYYALGLTRCQTGLERLDNPDGWPTPTEQSEDHDTMLKDAQALFDAICCFGGVAEAWQPLGPEAGLFGGEWTLWKEL